MVSALEAIGSSSNCWKVDSDKLTDCNVDGSSLKKQQTNKIKRKDTFVFAPKIVQSLYFLISRFQSFMLDFNIPVCTSLIVCRFVCLFVRLFVCLFVCLFVWLMPP